MLNRQQCSSNPCSTIGIGGNGCMTNLKSIGIGDLKLSPEAADAFNQMVDDMPSDVRDILKVSDAYRDAKTQCNIFDFTHYERTKKRRKKGTSGTAVALPGTSNHGWGRAIDLSPKKAQRWIKDNGSKYGWCWGEVKSEPWHFTFCGSGPNRWKGCDSICNVKGGTPIVTQKLSNKKIKKPTTIGLTQSFYTGEAADNIQMIINKMKSRGITNPIVQAAILATIGKESAFVPKNEIPYNNTDNSRIRSTFSSTKKLSDRKLDRLKKDPEAFFNYVYGPPGVGKVLGNTQPGDGYKYRGRGFNGITGRANYRKYGYESNPEALNSPEGSAEAALNFLAKEGSSLNNKFDNVDEALSFFVTRNAGGVRKPGEEAKAKNVLSRFDIDSEGEFDSGETLADVSSETPEDKKKSLMSLLGLGDLDAMIALAKGDESAFEKATSTLKEDLISEEVDRIKDIIKKIL